ncbi:MAG: DUF533 domain-containing protein [Pseudomonadota bacterium]
MSLMKTLAKVAIGVAVAKGASAMMQKRTEGGAGQAGLGGLLGGLTGGAAGGGSSMQDMLGGLLGGAQGGAGGGLGAMLDGIGGSESGLGLAGMLGGAGGGAGLAGMLGGAGAGGLLGGLAGALGSKPQEAPASFGAVLNSQFDQTPEPAMTPSADQEAAAALMLRAMIQAAKCDGQLDAAEEQKLVGQLGDEVDAEEAAFVRAEMQRPVDVDGLVAEVPQGLGPQVYLMSVLAIDLDSQAEAQYLHSLAQGLGLNAAAVNEIHAQLGVPSLYT